MTSSSLLWGLCFGMIGFGFFLYGRRSQSIVPLACGVALMIFPYFISSIPWMIGVGVALMVIPFLISY
ncbi:MAG: hypothetical protein KDC10_05965 [Calditrichaeota bacterium]|nr:hypothetical protein [Candidatus Cloacimonadota bacterium]MCB1046730.1 hypothetical protein [Calditrichota bacterium]